MTNPKWQRDELILALDLYFRFNLSQKSNKHSAVIELSRILNSLPIHSYIPDKEKYRNANSVYMKLGNFSSLDPNYQGLGLQRGGKLDEIIWKEFSNDKQYLSAIAKSIINGVSSAAAPENIFESDELKFPEGRILYRLHRMRERNNLLINKVKCKAIKEDLLKCEVCNFDFHSIYGDLGKGYIECHHTLPLSSYLDEENTAINNIALVCSNCHRMLHIKRPWLTLKELKIIIRE